MVGPRTGQPWTEEEVAIALEAYLRMLEWELEGRSFVKADVYRSIEHRLPARSKKSVELKWCNVSAVLQQAGRRWVDGYKPMPNYQRSLVDAVEE